MTGVFGMLSAEWVLVVITSTMSGTAAGYWICHAALAVLGFCGALFAVPVQTFLQKAPAEGTRGKAFAVNNFLNFIFIFLAGIFYMGTSAIELHPGIAGGLAGCALTTMLFVQRKAVLRMDEASAGG